MLVRLVALAASLSVLTSQPIPSQANSAGDPNERICEGMTVVGSRLAVKVCATRASGQPPYSRSKGCRGDPDLYRLDPPGTKSSRMPIVRLMPEVPC
jgi:hypothetical protein